MIYHDNSGVQSQKAESVYSTNKQILPFGFAEQIYIDTSGAFR